MNITRENVDELNAVLKINVSQDDYKPVVLKSLKDLSKKVDLKGFRKGMVPVGIVKKMYGNQVLAEELNRMINTELGKYLEENNIQVLGNPLPKEVADQNIDVAEEKDYEFEYELGLSPDFSVEALGKKTKITQHVISVDEKMVDEEVERLRKRLGTTTNPEDAVLEDDVVYVELTELSASEGAITNEVAIAVESFNDDKVKQEVMALNIGDSLDLDLFGSIDRPREEIAKHYLAVEGGNVDEISDKFKLTLKKINRQEPAELNQDFFDQVFGPGVVESEEGLRDKMKEELTKVFENETKMKLHYDLRDKLIQNTEIPLPDEFLKRWIQMSNEQPVTPEQIEQEYDGFAENLKWNLIVNKIGKANDVKVEPDEMMEHTKQNIIKQFNLPEGTMDEEQLTTWSQNVLQDKDHAQKTYEHLMEEKLFEIIKEQVTIEEKSVSLDEFKSLNQ